VWLIFLFALCKWRLKPAMGVVMVAIYFIWAGHLFIS
jgi:hypothetical protein